MHVTMDSTRWTCALSRRWTCVEEGACGDGESGEATGAARLAWLQLALTLHSYNIIEYSCAILSSQSKHSDLIPQLFPNLQKKLSYANVEPSSAQA